MNWQEALEQIQSVELDVNLNVVSSTDAFFEAVAREPAVLNAYSLMRESGELREEVLGRLSDLVRMESDPHYENPNDTPLATLLWLTNFAARDFAAIAASWVERAPRCWHARKLAQRILNPPPSLTNNPRVSSEPFTPVVSDAYGGDGQFLWTQILEEPLRFNSANPVTESSFQASSWEIFSNSADTGTAGVA